jgi:hypothetical protein
MNALALAIGRAQGNTGQLVALANDAFPQLALFGALCLAEPSSGISRAALGVSMASVFQTVAPLTRSLARSLTHSLTHSLIHSHSPTH